MSKRGVVGRKAFITGEAAPGWKVGEVVLLSGPHKSRYARIVGRVPNYAQYEYELIPRWEIWGRRLVQWLRRR